MTGKSRSRVIADALHQGLQNRGIRHVVTSASSYGKPRAKVAAFYGFQGELPRIMKEYRKDGRRVVFVDLGYWSRRQGGRYKGYHKVSLNDRHPTNYIMDKERKPDRLRMFPVSVQPWQTGGGHILVAGMSAKSAASYGFTAEQWERCSI